MTEPSLDQYPGYFPPAKPPFWTRRKTGITTGMVGLLIGLMLGAGGSADTAPEAEKPPAEQEASALVENNDEPEVDEAEIQRRVDEAVAAARTDLEAKLADQRETAKARLAEVRANAAAAQRKAVQAAIANTRADERAKAQEAIAAARADAEADAAAEQPVPFAGSGGNVGGGGGMDPIFDTCGEANDNGYGEYVSGRDPEYDYYDDRDGDGVVCEF